MSHSKKNNIYAQYSGHNRVWYQRRSVLLVSVAHLFDEETKESQCNPLQFLIYFSAVIIRTLGSFSLVSQWI